MNSQARLPNQRQIRSHILASEPLSFHNIRRKLTALTHDTSNDRLIALDRMKAILRKCDAKTHEYTNEQLAWAWLSVGQIHRSVVEQSLPAYDALCLSEEYFEMAQAPVIVGTPRSLFAFELYSVLTHIAMQNKRHIHAQIAYHKMFTALAQAVQTQIDSAATVPQPAFMKRLATLSESAAFGQ
jgi:hypothetical protein